MNKDYWEQRASKQGRNTVGYGGLSDEEFKQRSEEWKRKLLGLISPYAPKDRKLKVLDFGAGCGRFSKDLKQMFGDYVGIDISSNILKLAREDNPDLEYREIEEGKIPLPDNSVDVIWSITVLQHIVDPVVFNNTVDELYRVLSPNGLMFLYENTSENRQDLSHIHFRDPKFYKSFFNGVDLKIVSHYIEDGNERHTVMIGRGKNKILMTSGAGVGNMIQMTPTFKAFKEMGYKLCLYFDSNVNESYHLLGDIVDHVFFAKHDTVPYEVFDFLINGLHEPHENYCKQFYDHPKFLKIEYDQPGKVNDVIRSMTAAQKFGWNKHVPDQYCKYDQFDVKEFDLAFCPSCSTNPYWSKKKWNYWVKLAHMFPDKQIAVIGGPGDSDGMLFPDNVTDYCGKTSLIKSASILKGCKQVIAIDNGMAHIAAALGKEVLVIFGPTDHVKCMPAGNVKLIKRNLSCIPCQYKPDVWNGCNDWKCMDIHPNTIKKLIVGGTND